MWLLWEKNGVEHHLCKHLCLETHEFLMQCSQMNRPTCVSTEMQVLKYIKISQTSPKKKQPSKTVTIPLSQKPRACSLASIIKHSLPSIITSCLLVCLEGHGLSPPCIHQWCFNIHNDVKHAHLIYYLVIFPGNKTHFWFYLVWSRHCISIIFSLNINHGFVGDAFHLLLKDSNGLLFRLARL